MPNTNSNSYTFIYASVLTLMVAVALAAAATGLKPIQQQAIDLDKKRSILNAVATFSDKNQILKEYAEKVTEVVIDKQGNEVQGAKAFDLVLKKEFKKPDAERKLPLYVYNSPEGKKYIVPMHGAGLWDEIWGYVALDEDMNTIKGTSFDHKGETPGLGAEINQPWFKTQFQGKQLSDAGVFKLDIIKGKGADPNNKFQVDGISGATITGDGVNAMMQKSFESYKPYFERIKSAAKQPEQPVTHPPSSTEEQTQEGGE
ncbi:MAG TPA: NADH:ubiquinone reductase (Na(+)-transporting) subunit C [Chitinophagales bacterium]|nr:NADH:ubiquinone reductase (Na(+)-transporting) subunit C [Chitinophagales bacterium]HRK28268.1 NADH:ubiquinone reductase (Na(+)-transporting) subunit C [Chitinophagales bacterium]